MEWLNSLVTLAGVAVGVVATLAADRLRWKREVARQTRLDHRQLYEQYLTTLHEAGEALWALAHSDLESSTTPDVAARAIFRSAGVYAALERVLIGGPIAVHEAARESFHAMRDLRDAIAAGALVGGPEHQAAEKKWEVCRDWLRSAMRADLQSL
jgi:hypothetical protein